MSSAKLVCVVSMCALTLFLLAPSVTQADPCAQGVASFHRVDALLDKIPSKWIITQKESLWTEASRLLQKHEQDRVPIGCNVDVFEIAKVHAEMHFLDFSFASNTQTIEQRWGIAADIWLRFFNALLDRHPTEEQRRVFRTRFAREYKDTIDWRDDLMAKGAATNSKPVTDEVRAHFPSSSICETRSIEATASNPDVPDIPAAGMRNKGTITTLVRVYLDETGKVLKTVLEDSSGVDAYDQSVINAAKRSTYLPAVKDCRRVPGQYLFRATFSAGP